jgi:hypothetical protein
LMLVYSLLDPIRITTAGVLVAVGKPGKISLVRLLQLPVLLAGLFILGLRYQIAGVALAIDAMVAVGVIVSLYLVRADVDFSLSRMFAAPTLALAAGLGLNFLVINLWDLSSSAWLALLIKGTAFSLGYLGVIALLEGVTLYQAFSETVDLAAFVRQARQRFGG